MAVKCSQYTERPLIGCVNSVTNDGVVIDWYVGSYSGTWKAWKGRVDGKSTIFQQNVKLEDVLSKVELSKSMRLSSKTVAALKELYM